MYGEVALACTWPRPQILGMDPDADPLRLSGARSRTYGFAYAPRSLAGRIAGFVVGAVALVAAFALSIVVFVVALTGAAVIGGWLWWKTRTLRKDLREVQSRIRPGEREVRGESIVVRTDEGAAPDASDVRRQ